MIETMLGSLLVLDRMDGIDLLVHCLWIIWM